MQKKLKSEGLVSRGNKDFFGIIYNIRMFFATAISIIAVFAVILAFTAITPRARAEDLPQDRTALEAQLKDLETTINNTDCDSVIIATPIDLNRIINIRKPNTRVYYDLQEIGDPNLSQVIDEFVKQHKLK